MSGAIAPFLERYRRALGDDRLRTNLLTFQRSWRLTREVVFDRLAQEAPALGASFPTFETARQHLVAVKDDVLADPLTYKRAFVEKATQAGAQVHDVATAEQARELILELLKKRDVQLLAKGKSMLAEEIFLNHHLEAAGLRVVETDLGEWIIQLAHETPSHMVMPAIHKSRQQVADLFESEVHRSVDHQDIKGMVDLARGELRRVFVSADAGLIGANALIADTGSVLLVTNEGNGDLVATLPRLLIVIAGFEKLLPTLADAGAHLRLLARSATSQEITTYTSLITGAEPGREVHIVLVDNGRSAMYADPDFRDALRCIRCAACADICPPYQVLGGHVFGYVYSGAIGLVNTAFHHGIEAAAGPQALCVSCNACATVCPARDPAATPDPGHPRASGRGQGSIGTQATCLRGLSTPARVRCSVPSGCHRPATAGPKGANVRPFPQPAGAQTLGMAGYTGTGRPPGAGCALRPRVPARRIGPVDQERRARQDRRVLHPVRDRSVRARAGTCSGPIAAGVRCARHCSRQPALLRAAPAGLR